MAHEIAKRLLEQADSFLNRSEAIRAALSQGMSLREIEAFLDWLDLMREQRSDRNRPSPPSAES